MKRASAMYRALLYGYPAPFRHEYGDEMHLMFAQELGEARRSRARGHEARLWALVVVDLLTVAPREHWHVIKQDLRYAIRTMTAKPAFASIAILSLALGIGANTAIFNLWNRVLNAPLPGVDRPEQLVMLSNPNTIGSLRGRWNSRTDGPRSWLSYAEFEQLRDHTSVFSAVMASESRLSTWQGRIDRGQPEPIRGRLVSGGFFEVLGVQPAIGRLFTSADDGADPPSAVISYAYWLRRFGGRPDVIGRTLTLRETTVTIIGVTRAGFVGETSGQLPDFWLPIRLQPRLFPSDWLREQAPDKMMWLHAFGRLEPGVTIAQADAQVNAVFQAGLQSFYGASTIDRHPEFLDQRLALQPGARGASSTRADISSSLRVLLAAVGILLLIACANLANLLLARGAARQAEIAVRLSLGASRARLVRQLVTESLALAAAGGIVAIGVAYVLHGFLVRLLQNTDPQFFMSFAFDLTLVGFTVAATVAAALAFGALPAWQMTALDPGTRLKDTSRGAIGSRRELRSSRSLVGMQLALSLPLLVGAGLLVRTVYNMQRPDLGFRSERLLLAEVELGTLTQDVARRDRVLRDLRARLERIPGVEAASFSQLGLFGGMFSSAVIEVEGGTPADRQREYALDRVGTGYFTTLGIPIRRGRDIAEADRADSQKVCIVNDAFVQRFFSGRDPIGLHVTTVEDNEVRTSYEVVGVAGNAHTQALRGDVGPRFFLPAEQRPSFGTTRTFLIRPAKNAMAILPVVRQTVEGTDAALSLAQVTSMEEQLAPFTADERNIAQLGVVFGILAIGLAAIGLYGVLSYGVARRASEIAIRIALGAQSRNVIGMILRENAWLVAAGLTAGGVMALWGSRLIESRLFGVAPHDPLTLTVSTAVLVLVALGATYLPARRASKADPVAALHQG
jgi:predicted permease